MDMDVDNMDTAFLKSWGEVLRRTDPLLWSLAFETSSTVPSTSSSSSTMATPAHSRGVHNSQNNTYASSDPDHWHQLSQASLLSQSPSTTLQAKESSSSSKLAPQVHTKQSFCQSLLNPHDAHALDWLKCLILREDYDVLASGNKSHNMSSAENNRRLGVKQTQDFGPVGQVISRRTGSMHANPSVPISSSGSSAAAGSSNTPTSAASTSSSSSSSSSTTASTATAAVGALAGAVHVGIGAGYRPRQQQQMAGAGIMDSAVQPLSAVSDSAAKMPLTPSAIHASDAVAATAAVSDATHNREASLTNVNPATPPPHQPAAVVPTSGSGSISSNASANSTTKASAGAAATATTTSSSISSADSSPSSTSPLSSPAPAAGVSTSTSRTSLSKILPFLPSITTPIVLPTLDTLVPMAQKQLIRSKDATVAFFYRTFSPTYRISQLYIDSWSNGSQKRGLDRIQKAFVEGHAFTVVKVATSNMKDIWQQVVLAYKIKSANAKAEKARRLSKSAKKGK